MHNKHAATSGQISSFLIVLTNLFPMSHVCPHHSHPCKSNIISTMACIPCISLVQCKGNNFGALHTMAEGREAVNFHQSNCKKPRVWSLDPSHYGQRSLQLQNDYFLKKAMNSRRKFGLDKNRIPNYGRSRGRRFFFIKKSIIDKILAVRLEGYLEQGI